MDKRKFGKKLKQLMKIVFSVAMLAITVLCASADAYAWGFSAFGFAVGSDGIHREQNQEIEYEYMDTAGNGAGAGSGQMQGQGNTDTNGKNSGNQVKSQNQYQNQNQYQYEYQNQNMYEESFNDALLYDEEGLLNIEKAVDRANSDPFACNVLKEFSGEYFCLSTEQRIAFFYVNDDGSLEWLESQPDDCMEIETNEIYANRVWQKVQNRERISAREFEDNVAMPWKMRMKIAWMGLWNKATG